MRFRALPVRTHLIRPGDDLVQIVRRYIKDIAEPGDVVALSESMVAIAQGRAFTPDSVRARWLARVLCRFAHPDGSLATPAAMELAIREAGPWRVLAGAAAAAAGRLVGQHGWFYRVADRGINLIDDIGGTLYPFDRYIVLGPLDVQALVERIKDATGVETMVVDVNDIRCVDVLGYSGHDDPAPAVEALRSNPQGNDDEQTPIVVLKRLSHPPAGGTAQAPHSVSAAHPAGCKVESRAAR